MIEHATEIITDAEDRFFQLAQLGAMCAQPGISASALAAYLGQVGTLSREGWDAIRPLAKEMVALETGRA